VRSKIKRKKSWYLIWTLVFLFFVASLASIIITLPVFKIVKIEVEGTRLISPEQILKAAAIPSGENLFLTRFSQAISRIRAISTVKEVKISRRLPDTVLIIIKERREAAVTVLDDRSVLVDEEGVILDVRELPDISGLPVLLGVKKAEDISGSVTKLLTEFKNYISPKKLEIDLTDSDDINLIFDDTLRVKFGDSNKLESKFNVFETIYDKIREKKDSIEYIDLRFPEFPAVKFKK